MSLRQRTDLNSGIEVIATALAADFDLGDLAATQWDRNKYLFQVNVGATDVTFDTTAGALNAFFEVGNDIEIIVNKTGVGNFLVVTPLTTLIFDSINDAFSATVISSSSIRTH